MCGQTGVSFDRKGAVTLVLMTLGLTGMAGHCLAEGFPGRVEVELYHLTAPEKQQRKQFIFTLFSNA